MLEDFFEVCPETELYVVDNASEDRAFELAKELYQEIGCKGKLLSEPRKGNAGAVRRGLMDVDTDVYVMVDADLTYPASVHPNLLKPVRYGKVEIVCGDRHSSGAYCRENKRPIHNWLTSLSLS